MIFRKGKAAQRRCPDQVFLVHLPALVVFPHQLSRLGIKRVDVCARLRDDTRPDECHTVFHHHACIGGPGGGEVAIGHDAPLLRGTSETPDHFATVAIETVGEAIGGGDENASIGDGRGKEDFAACIEAPFFDTAFIEAKHLPLIVGVKDKISSGGGCGQSRGLFGLDALDLGHPAIGHRHGSGTVSFVVATMGDPILGADFERTFRRFTCF